jgi:hypothetical protein
LVFAAALLPGARPGSGSTAVGNTDAAKMISVGSGPPRIIAVRIAL